MFDNKNELEAREEILARSIITRNSTKRETEYHTQAVCMTARK